MISTTSRDVEVSISLIFKIVGLLTCSGSNIESLSDNTGITTYNGITLKDFNNGIGPSTNPLQRKTRYGQIYFIQARAKVNGVFGDYGPVCTITTESQPTTKLRPAYCGATVSQISTNIYANSVTYATTYQWEVIGAGGTSAWERCCLGLPSIVVVLADNQKIVSKNLCKAGVIYIIKDNESLSKSLENKLSTLNNNINHYKEMSIKAASITDGVGVKLVVKAMEV